MTNTQSTPQSYPTMQRSKALSRRTVPFAHMLMLVLLTMGTGTGFLRADETATPASPRDAAQLARFALDDTGLTPLDPAGTVLMDLEGKRILVKARIGLREGTLEMLMCPTGTKGHESILECDAPAVTIHAGLLRIGAKAGRPVQFQPEYQPPTGQLMSIYLRWQDEAGKLQRVPAHEWIRYSVYRYFESKLEQLPDDFVMPKKTELRYDKPRKDLLWYGPMTEQQRDELLALSAEPQYQQAIRRFFGESQERAMQARWIFAGSGFSVNETTGEKIYRAQSGDLICVANFPSAMIDIDLESAATGGPLTFEAWTDHIPPKGTEVTVELIPVFTATPVSRAKEPAESAARGR